jgi:hypothetical protein
MSLADKKRSVFTTIGSYNSLMEQGEDVLQTDLFPSINNKDDIVPFILDVLKTVAGTEAIKEAMGGMFSDLVDEVEPKLKTELKKQFIQSNSDDIIPSSFMTNGITVPVKNIDISGKFKVDPSSAEGSLIYGATTGTFNSTAYDAILNAGDFEDFNNLQIKFLAGSDSLQIRPLGSAPKIGDFFTTYIDNTELINKKELISAVMDNFYGTLANNQTKTEEQVYNELLVETQLQQVLNGDDSFVVEPELFDQLQAKARELVAGAVTYDLGCGQMPASLEFDDFSETVSKITGATDPFFIGDQLGATIDDSTNSLEETQDLTTENKETMKDGFFQKLINIFSVKMLEATVVAPQVRTLLGMMSSLQNEGTTLLSNASEDLENFKTCIKCMSKEIIALIAEFLFALAISYLIKLLKPVILKVIKEKINQYTAIITSLTGAGSKISDALT